MMTKNFTKLYRRNNRRHKRYVRQRNDDTVPFCKEHVLERHPTTGLPLLTECKFENGNIIQIQYKNDGSWVVDNIIHL
jgi:hypothetical protein